jgi:hypothetical protein
LQPFPPLFSLLLLLFLLLLQQLLLLCLLLGRYSLQQCLKHGRLCSLLLPQSHIRGCVWLVD